MPHYLQGFIHPRWLFGISSINSILWWGTSNSTTFSFATFLITNPRSRHATMVKKNARLPFGWWFSPLPPGSWTLRPWKIPFHPIGSRIVFLSPFFRGKLAVKLRGGIWQMVKLIASWQRSHIPSQPALTLESSMIFPTFPWRVQPLQKTAGQLGFSRDGS